MRLITIVKPEHLDLAVPVLQNGQSTANLRQIMEGYSKFQPTWVRACNVEYRSGPNGPAIGILAERGTVHWKTQISWPVFYVDAKGNALIAPNGHQVPLQTARLAFSVAPMLVRDGQVLNVAQEIARTEGLDDSLRPGQVLPRAAIGIRPSDGAVIHLADDGATLDEVASTMRVLGCTQAAALDGGGSVGVVDRQGNIVMGQSVRQVCSALVFREVAETRKEESPLIVAPAGNALIRLGLRYFEDWEHACPCCNTILVTRESAEVMYRLDEMRHEYGSPIGCVPRDRSLARGFACEKRLGHEDGSRHYSPHGDGRDIVALTRPQTTLESLVLKYFREGGIGVYAWGYHVDLGPRRRWGTKSLPL